MPAIFFSTAKKYKFASIHRHQPMLHCLRKQKVLKSSTMRQPSSSGWRFSHAESRLCIKHVSFTWKVNLGEIVYSQKI